MMVLGGCASANDPVGSPGSVVPTLAVDEAAPILRLDQRAIPRSYALHLWIDPEVEGFTGEVSIDLSVLEPSRVIWLNSRAIAIESAELTMAGETLPASILDGNEEVEGFAFDREIPAGPARMTIRYTAPFEEVETQGAFRQKDEDEWYVFTQFESVYAREAFPSFDEPMHKTPWTITISAPEDVRAYANTPLVRSSPDERAGWVRHEFATSEPLPSYLVAFAVGPFDEVDAGRVGDTPLRIITLKGKQEQAAYAAAVTAPILELQEAYTGIPYAYAKLDSISIPSTVGFGAMENVGLITYIERLIAAHPAEQTVRFERAYASVAAHEIAHQWFGDLVTPEWWNDIWLNESFASWFGSKTMEQWRPEWKAGVDRIDTRRYAISADSMATANQIRRPIRNEGDIETAFDSISYSKGATLLAGFERWIGQDEFQRGIQSYLRRYAHDTATSDEFLQELEDATRPGVAAAFSTFLDQPGVPLLSARLNCEEPAAPVVELAQQRYLPVGSEAESERLWQIPVCVRWPGAEHGQCSLVTGAQSTIRLEGAEGCPLWILLNDGGMGYYLTDYTAEALEALPFEDTDILTEGERLALLQDARILFAGGRIPATPTLEMVRVAARSDERNLIEAAVAVVNSLDPWLVPDDLEPAYVSLIQDLFGARAREIGLTPREGESEEITLLRDAIVETVAGPGEDAELRAEALALANAWLADSSAVPAESVGMVLGIAAKEGGEELYQRYIEALRGESDRRNRSRLIDGLSSFTEPDLVERSFRLLLDPDLDPRESMAGLYAGSDLPELIAVRNQFLETHYEEISSRLPEMYVSYLPFASAGYCDASRIPEVREFWTTRLQKIRGGSVNLERAIESLRLCSAWREAQAEGTRAFLESIASEMED